MKYSLLTLPNPFTRVAQPGRCSWPKLSNRLDFEAPTVELLEINVKKIGSTAGVITPRKINIELTISYHLNKVMQQAFHSK